MRPYGDIAKYILLGVGVAGLIVVAAVAPGALLAAKPFMDKHRRPPRRYNGRNVARTLRRLEKSNLLRIKKKGDGFAIELTKGGKQKFQEIQLRENQLAKLRIRKPSRWDGRWRIVIFDIPEETFRSARGMLRAKLKEWEFYPLQKSVWACPWPCEKEIQLATDLYGISRYVNILVTEKISRDIPLREHFGLPKN